MKIMLNVITESASMVPKDLIRPEAGFTMLITPLSLLPEITANVVSEMATRSSGVSIENASVNSPVFVKMSILFRPVFPTASQLPPDTMPPMPWKCPGPSPLAPAFQRTSPSGVMHTSSCVARSATIMVSPMVCILSTL